MLHSISKTTCRPNTHRLNQPTSNAAPFCLGYSRNQDIFSTHLLISLPVVGFGTTCQFYSLATSSTFFKKEGRAPPAGYQASKENGRLNPTPWPALGRWNPKGKNGWGLTGEGRKAGHHAGGVKKKKQIPGLLEFGLNSKKPHLPITLQASLWKGPRRPHLIFSILPSSCSTAGSFISSYFPPCPSALGTGTFLLCARHTPDSCPRAPQNLLLHHFQVSAQHCFPAEAFSN